MGRTTDESTGICVLIVEDDDDSREMLGEWVSSLGHRQLPAANAEQALSQTLASRPQLALIDPVGNDKVHSRSPQSWWP